MKLLLALLIAALIAVVAVITLRQMEYSESRDYYNGLRTGKLPGTTDVCGGKQI